jgi:hypothetical protein
LNISSGEDDFVIFVKSMPLSEALEASQIKNGLEKLIALRHPCITAPVGFVFPIGSGSRETLKTVRLYLEGCSLSEVLLVNPVW